MTKAAVKERDEPSLPLSGMKDVTPPKSKATEKPQTKRVVAIATKPASRAVVASGKKEPTNMLAVIARAASDPKVNPDNMRALLDMQKEIMAEEARRSFTDSYIAMQAQLPTINAKGRIVIPPKDGKAGQSTPYAKFNDIIRAVNPVLRQHGFTLSFATEPSVDGTRLIVKGFLDHTAGHQRMTSFPLPAEVSGSKNNVQGWGSSMSYGKRYATIALLNIISEAMEEQDLDGRFPQQIEGGVKDEDQSQDQGSDSVPSTINTAQITEIKKEIEACGVPIAKFLTFFEIKKIEDLKISKFAQAVQACKDYTANQARKN